MGPRVALSSQRQGGSIAEALKQVSAFLERLKLDRFEAPHQQALLNMFPENEQEKIKALLKGLRKFPLEVGLDASNNSYTITMPLFKAITCGDTLQFLSYNGAFEYPFKEQLATTLESLQLNTDGWKIVNIRNEKIVLSFSLKGKSREEIREEITEKITEELIEEIREKIIKEIREKITKILPHLPAIIQALQSVRA